MMVMMIKMTMMMTRMMVRMMTRIMAAVLKWGERVEASCDEQHGRLRSNWIQDVDDDEGEASFEHAGKTDLDPFRSS